MRYMLWAGSTRGFSKRLGAEIAKLQALADDERLCAAARVAVRTLLWQHAQGWPPVQPVVRRPPEEQSVADEEEDGEDVKDEAGETTPDGGRRRRERHSDATKYIYMDDH
jgi:hypothetical protein